MEGLVWLSLILDFAEASAPLMGASCHGTSMKVRWSTFLRAIRLIGPVLVNSCILTGADRVGPEFAILGECIIKIIKKIVSKCLSGFRMIQKSFQNTGVMRIDCGQIASEHFE
jgi:hypothetical protein